MVKIERVADCSLAESVGIKSGDILISINGHEINDVLDYRFYLADTSVSVKIKNDTES